MRRCVGVRARLTAAAALLLLGGCGQKGPLYLPEKGGAVVTTPAPPPPAPVAPGQPPEPSPAPQPQSTPEPPLPGSAESPPKKP
ncbi:MAG: lipoprotein, partial [Gammaproteobacteria bacterium]|nr:lipoprotein [Gammaproteobacteria bacterium]